MRAANPRLSALDVWLVFRLVSFEGVSSHVLFPSVLKRFAMKTLELCPQSAEKWFSSPKPYDLPSCQNVGYSLDTFTKGLFKFAERHHFSGCLRSNKIGVVSFFSANCDFHVLFLFLLCSGEAFGQASCGRIVVPLLGLHFCQTSLIYRRDNEEVAHPVLLPW